MEARIVGEGQAVEQVLDRDGRALSVEQLVPDEQVPTRREKCWVRPIGELIERASLSAPDGDAFRCSRERAFGPKTREVTPVTVMEESRSPLPLGGGPPSRERRAVAGGRRTPICSKRFRDRKARREDGQAAVPDMPGGERSGRSRWFRTRSPVPALRRQVGRGARPAPGDGANLRRWGMRDGPLPVQRRAVLRRAPPPLLRDSLSVVGARTRETLGTGPGRSTRSRPPPPRTVRHLRRPLLRRWRYCREAGPRPPRSP